MVHGRHIQLDRQQGQWPREVDPRHTAGRHPTGSDPGEGSAMLETSEVPARPHPGRHPPNSWADEQRNSAHLPYRSSLGLSRGSGISPNAQVLPGPRPSACCSLCSNGGVALCAAPPMSPMPRPHQPQPSLWSLHRVPASHLPRRQGPSQGSPLPNCPSYNQDGLP